MTAEPLPYDFRKPHRLADDIEHILSKWQARAGTAIADRWALHCGINTEWEVRDLESSRSRDVVRGLDAPFVAFSLLLEEDTEIMWFLLSRRLVVTFVEGMFGDAPEEMPADRPLTDVENALVEMVMQEVQKALVEGQPCAQPKPCPLQGEKRLRELTRAFPEQEQITLARFHVSASCGQGEAIWILSQAAVLSFATHVSECRIAKRTDAGEMAHTMRKIPLEVVVGLGRASIHVADLVNLQVGDIVVLDQRVTDPLYADVAGTTKFRGWPGRLGTRQAFQIGSLVPPEDQ